MNEEDSIPAGAAPSAHPAADKGLEGDAEADEETGDGPLVQQDAELHGPFRQRPRSELKRLPLSVEESFRSLKDELWGKIGVHRATRLHVRTSWKEKVTQLCMKRWQKNYDQCSRRRTAASSAWRVERLQLRSSSAQSNHKW